jgi:hypothetical protein
MEGLAGEGKSKGGEATMRCLRARWPVFAVLFLALATGWLGTGCAQIQVVDQDTGIDALASAPITVGMTTGAAHDIAIMGIDFAPPLKQALSSNQITLLVAIENKGTQVENNVVVEARLLSSTQESLLQGVSRLETIAPGEVKIASFSDFAPIPIKPDYQLAIHVPGVPGETRLADNDKHFRLQIVGPGSTP